MKRIICFGVLAAAVLFAGDLQATDVVVKIGYADLQKALNESGPGKEAKEELRKEYQRREEALNPDKEELVKLREELEKKASVWNDETRRKKEQEFFKKSQDFQQRTMKSGEELNKIKQESEAKILDELSRIVAELAQKHGYTYVFEMSLGALLYAPPDADLTEELIETYNKNQEEEKK
jgi:outer membrane protein